MLEDETEVLEAGINPSAQMRPEMVGWHWSSGGEGEWVRRWHGKMPWSNMLTNKRSAEKLE
eukprot:2101750-Prorocentrum_lima.AAC.1